MPFVYFPAPHPLADEASELGGKAGALARLQRHGMPIPPWFVVLPAACVASGQEGGNFAAAAPAVHEAITRGLDRLSPEEGTRFAVRSSAMDEDGAEHSFAGQLESYLFVSRHDVPDRVKDVWASAGSERLIAYRQQRGLTLPPPAPAVLVQIMVDAEAAGVAFSADPVTGNRSTFVVAAVPGLGSGLVSGDCNADTFRLDASFTVIEERIAEKRQVHRPDPRRAEGVSCAPVQEPQRPAIDGNLAAAVARLAAECAAHFGRPQDIEWAWKEGRLWLLQSRPITSLMRLPDPAGQLVLWDNSNIAESYSGVITPLTFSFARRVYEEVYREFCRILSVPQSDIEKAADTFRCMLGLLRGRIYYNLLNWYRVLAMLPGFDLNRGFMEQMMGVKEPLPQPLIEQVLVERTAASGARSYWRLAVGFTALARAHRRLEATRDAFTARLNHALELPGHGLAAMRLDELASHYRRLERQLLTRWDAPLINDFLAMIFFGVLRKMCVKWCGDENERLANELVMAEGSIISAEPARRIRAMARSVQADPDMIRLLESGNTNAIHAGLASRPDLKRALKDYLDAFGDRCLEELKLETVTLSDDPTTLFQSVGRLARSLSERPAAPAALATGSDPNRCAAEQETLRRMRGRLFRPTLFRWVLRNARQRIRDRENLRFERTRIFGRVRRIFLEMGRRLRAEGRLDDARDIFYLTLDEALGYVEGTAVSWELRPIVTARQAEFAAHQRAECPAGRFETLGAPPIGNGLQATARGTSKPSPGPGGGDCLRGLGCCPGVVRARARVVLDPRHADAQPGEILVAGRTDPGWITLFASAAGVAVEHGSLLSHSAIVAREMGIPGIISVPGLTQWVRDGEWVELDGAQGTIRKVEAPSA
jgi:pyruvate,water dikinase